MYIVFTLVILWWGQSNPLFSLTGKDRLVYYVDKLARTINRVSLNQGRPMVQPEIIFRRANPSQMNLMDKSVTLAWLVFCLPSAIDVLIKVVHFKGNGSTPQAEQVIIPG